MENSTEIKGLGKMKKKLLIAIVLLCAYFIGCSDSDSTSNSVIRGDLARYTVVVVGTAEGMSDSIMEDTYNGLQPLMESNDVRVLFCYKYGTSMSYAGFDPETGEDIMRPFTGKYAKPGQFVTFELTKDTDLKKIAKNSVIAADSSQSLYEPGFLAKVLNYASDSLPAQNYVLLFYGHGEGFHFAYDYPKDKRDLALVKTQLGATAAILPDDWDEDEYVNMYEVRREIEKSTIKHLKAIYFHNCLMGNMESLSEVYSLADYLIASEHSLASDGMIIVDFVKELYKDGDFENTMKSYLDNTKDHWKLEYEKEGMNGDLKVLKSSEFEDLFPIFKKVANRLKVLYKDVDQRNNMKYALNSTYKVEETERFFVDALDYVQKLAEKTKDDTLTVAAQELQKAFEKLIVKKIETHYNKENDIDSFSLSVVFTSKYNMNLDLQQSARTDFSWGVTNEESYKNTIFHKETGWGDWLNANEFYVDSSEE